MDRACGNPATADGEGNTSAGLALPLLTTVDPVDNASFRT